MKRIGWLIIGALSAASGSLPGAPVPIQREELSAALLRAEKDPNSEFMVSVWQTGDGLPVNVIQELEQTPDGYLWLGTHQGLVRFDGVRFQSFFTTPAGLRYGPRVGALEVDARGRLWLAPDQVGLVCLEAGAFQEVLTNGSILPVRAENLCSDGGNGLMWVDANGGVGRVSTETPSRAEQLENSVPVGSRWVRDFEGRMWLVCPRSLRLYEAGRWREVEPAGGSTLVAAPRRRGGLWMASQGTLRSIRADGVSQEEAAFPWRGGGTRVTCLLEDSRRRLWIGTASQGLFCYTAGQFKHVLPTASSILSLLEDGEDNLWAGTRGGGLVRLRQRHFFVHDLRSGLENEFVSSLTQDKEGRVWMASAEGGLGWWRTGSWHKLGPEEGWPGLDSLCVAPAREGGVWISTARRGVWRWREGQCRRQELGPNAPGEPAMDLLEDRRGRLWIVTDNSGIFCLETNRLTAYSLREGLPSGLMRRVVEDEAGELWAGDWEGAVVRLRDGRWELVRAPSGHRDAVRSMVVAEGTVWIGTSAGGLLRFRNGQTARLSMEQGLPDACIQQLLADGRGALWGATPHRLFRAPWAQLNAAMDGRSARVDAITYGRSDGLPDTSFAFWSDPRCWRTVEGELWFATANGAIHFAPGNLPPGKPAQAVLEQILLDGKAVTPADLQHLRLKPGRLEFKFTAPCLTTAERIRFRYQLSGVDSDWVEAGTDRVATYASLPAGDHVFRVKASSPEGVWTTESATVALAVHPFFWQTTWFLAALAGGLTGGGVWLARYATVRRLHQRVDWLRRQRAVARERARIAQDIHDELGANLTSIGLLADMGTRHKSSPEAVGRDLEQIARTARESVTAMDAIVWTLNPRNDSLDHFANYLAHFTRAFFRPTPLRTRLVLPADLPVHPMSTETRHQLFLLVKESYNNLVRHAQATEVHLELACEAGHLRLSITDNGQGLPGQPPAPGQDGLANLRQRIERLGGTFAIQSEPRQGTRLDFILPLAKLTGN